MSTTARVMETRIQNGFRTADVILCNQGGYCLVHVGCLTQLMELVSAPTAKQAASPGQESSFGENKKSSS